MRSRVATVSWRDKEPAVKHTPRSETFKNIMTGVVAAVASILIPLVGLRYTEGEKNKETNKGLVELGIKILSEKPADNKLARPLRAWAIDVINKHSDVVLPADAKQILLDEVPIVSTPVSAERGIPKEALAKLESRSYTLGVDMSHFNNNVQYDVLKSRGVKFAYVKLTQGATYIDRSAPEHAKWLAAVGIKTGFYHWFQPSGAVDLQLSNFIAHLSEAHGDLPPCIDCEDAGSPGERSAYTGHVYEFATKLKARFGRAPLIYTSAPFAEANLDERFSVFPLWLAKYQGGDTPADPVPPKWWKQFTFWQINARTDDPAFGDLDVDAFRGSAEELDRFVQGKP